MYCCSLYPKEKDQKYKNPIMRKKADLAQNVGVKINQLDYYKKNSMSQIQKSSIVSAGEIRVRFKKRSREHQQEEYHQHSQNSSKCSKSSNRNRKSVINRNSEGIFEIEVKIEDNKYKKKEYNFLNQMQQLIQWIKNPATEPAITKIKLFVADKLKQQKYTFPILEQALEMLSSLSIMKNSKFYIIIQTQSEQQTNTIMSICKKIKDHQLMPSSILFPNQTKATFMQS